jgi:hypothetical protein
VGFLLWDWSRTRFYDLAALADNSQRFGRQGIAHRNLFRAQCLRKLARPLPDTKHKHYDHSILWSFLLQKMIPKHMLKIL